MDQETNLYAPPLAAVAETSLLARTLPEFYVVSARKFLLLFFFTMGMYPLYWFYQHWANYRTRHRERLSPVWRAVFAVFFTHRLANAINASLARGGTRHAWSSSLVATGYVLVMIASTVCDRLAANAIGSPYTDLVALASLVPMAACLLTIQRAANLACGDADAVSNRSLTWANWIWIVLGGLLWLVVALGLVVLLWAPTLA